MRKAIILTSVLAALAMSAPVAMAQGQMQQPGATQKNEPGPGMTNADYCLRRGGDSGTQNCTYVSMDSCLKDRQGTADCVPNAKSTTGSGGMTSPGGNMQRQ